MTRHDQNPCRRIVKIGWGILFAACLASATALPLEAQVQAPTDAAQLQSSAHAEASAKLLAKGQKRAAIITALKGLPEPFTPDTMTAFPDAWLSFYRAATALVVTAPYDGFLAAIANNDRTRVVFKGVQTGEEDVLAAVAPTVLWDAENDRQIAVIAQASEVNDESSQFAVELSTSIRSDIFSLAGAGTPMIRFFDMMVGAEVAALQIPPLWQENSVSPIGISPDGNSFAAKGTKTITLWDLPQVTAPRVIAPQLPDVDDLLFVQVKWTAEQDFIATYMWHRGPRQGQYGLARIRRDGTTRTIETGSPSVIWAASPHAPVFLALTVAEGSFAVRDLDLNVMGRLPGGVSPFAFSRGEAAIVVTAGLGGQFMEVAAPEPHSVYALDGTPLDLQPQDYLGFSDMIFNPQGQVTALIGPTELGGMHHYRIAPDGADLYARVMASLTPEERATLAAHRLGDAQPAPDTEAVQRLQSDRLAAQAVTAAYQGQRQEAIKLALAALPDDPDQAEMDRFGPAHAALFRAFASRQARFDTPSGFFPAFFSRARFGPLGRTAVYRQVEVEEATNSAVMTRATLFDTETRQTIDLQLATIDPRGLTDLHFSPDGQEIAGVGRSDGAVHVFDVATGRVTRTFDASGDREHTKTSQIGYSPDGRYFIATVGRIGRGDYAIWAAETGRLLYKGNPFDAYTFPLGWSHDGSVLVIEVEQREGSTYPFMNLVVWTPEGGSSRMRLLRADGLPVEHCQYSAISHAQPYMACSSDNETTVVNFASGSITGTIRRYEAAGTFLRDGTAIGWPSVSDPGEIDVFSVTGEKLEPVMQDYVAFGQNAFLGDGSATRVAVDLSGYLGQGLPTGLDLYQTALAELSPDDRARLQAGRATGD